MLNIRRKKRNMLVTKEFMFHAAHKLPGYEGKCKNLHGHTYKLHVTLEGEPDKSGMVLDFKEIKDTVEKEILSRLDHSYLNDIVEQPTAERTIMWIWENLESKLQGLYELKLWETPTSYVTYKGYNPDKGS